MVHNAQKQTIAWLPAFFCLLCLCSSSVSSAQESLNSLLQSCARADDRISSGRIQLQITEERGVAPQGGGSKARKSEATNNTTFQVVAHYSKEILFDKSRHIFLVRTLASGKNVPETKIRYDSTSVQGFTAFPDSGNIRGTRLVTVGKPSAVPTEVELWGAHLLHLLKETFDYDHTRLKLVGYEPSRKQYKFRMGGSQDPIFEILDVQLKTEPILTRFEIRERGVPTQTWQIGYSVQENGISYPQEVVQSDGSFRKTIRCTSAKTELRTN